MIKRDTDRIRLMGEDDAAAAGRFSARQANTVTLLSAALLADDNHVILFEAPVPHPEGEEEALMAAATLLHRDYTLEGLQGLELLCDGHTHFGCYLGFSRAERLLYAVARDRDPNFERAPFIVAVQA